MILHDWYMNTSLTGIAVATALATSIVAKYDPYEPNLCISSSKGTNARLVSAYVFATAVIALLGLRLKRTKLHAEDMLLLKGKEKAPLSDTVVGVFGGALHSAEDIFKLPKSWLIEANMNRGYEFLFHVVAIISSLVYLISVGSFTEKKCGGTWQQWQHILLFVSYYLCFLMEVLDGCVPLKKGTTKTEKKTTKSKMTMKQKAKHLQHHAEANWISLFLTTGLFAIACLTFARLSRSHDTDANVHCTHDQSVISLTLVSTVLAWVTMVTISIEKDDNDWTKQFSSNTFGWFFTFLTLCLLLLSYNHYDSPTLYPETKMPKMVNGLTTFDIVPAKKMSSTVCAQIDTTTHKWVKDDKSNLLLDWQIGLVGFFGVGSFVIVGLYYLVMDLTTYKAGKLQAKELMAGLMEDRGELESDLMPGIPPIPRSARLTGEGKASYTSVSTLNFV